MVSDSPAKLIIQKHDKQFFEKFGMHPNLYATESILNDSMARQMSEFSSQFFDGREFMKKKKLHKVIGEIIVDKELKIIDELVKQDNWTSASDRLRKMLENGRISVKKFKEVDEAKIQPLEKKLRAKIKKEQEEKAKQDEREQAKPKPTKKQATQKRKPASKEA